MAEGTKQLKFQILLVKQLYMKQIEVVTKKNTRFFSLPVA